MPHKQSTTIITSNILNYLSPKSYQNVTPHNKLNGFALIINEQGIIMKKYEKILVALDLSEESSQVLSRALLLKKAFDATLSIVHVIEPLGYAYGGDIPMDLSAVQEQLESQAITRLEEIGKEHNLNHELLQVVIGRPEAEIHRMALEGGFGLVIVGSHGRHGIQLLLGSTSNSVLHGAKCDVLAVRLEEPN